MPARAAKAWAQSCPWAHGAVELSRDSNELRIIRYDDWLPGSPSPKPRYRSFLEGTWVRVNGDRTRFEVYGHADVLISNRKKPVVS
jgi:hypothetical protein